LRALRGKGQNAQALVARNCSDAYGPRPDVMQDLPKRGCEQEFDWLDVCASLRA